MSGFFQDLRTAVRVLRKSPAATAAAVMMLALGIGHHVLRTGLGMTVAGGVAGIFLAIGAGRLVSAFLFGVEPTDATVFASSTLLLMAAALLACYIPARRASRVDPMQALRYD